MARHALARYRAPFRFSSPKPIVIRTTKVVKHKRHHRRHGGGGMGGLFGGNTGKIMMGAFALGLIQKTGLANNLPKIPFLGETGTIGLAAHFLGGRSGIAQDIKLAAFAIAAFELASTGAIVGEDPSVGYVAGW